MWWYVALWVASFAVTYALMPKPQNAKPAGFEDIKAPTAEIGREIPVLFGRRRLTGPNVVWYGDLKVEPIKSSGGKK